MGGAQFPLEPLRYLVNDYKLSLISATDMADSDFGKFSTELGDVMRFVKHQKDDVDKLIEQTNHRIYGPEAATFVKEAANMDLDFEVKNGGVDMCEALERRYKRERETEQRNRIEIMVRDGRTPEEIADFCKYPLDLVKEVEQNMMAMA